MQTKQRHRDPDGELLELVVRVLVIASIFISWVSALYTILEAAP